MKILLATGNQGKATEIKKFLGNVPNLELLTLQDLSESFCEPKETGNSYQENALQKAMHYFNHSGIPTLAEDSGIEIDAIKNELGIKTRRWGAGPNASDEEWMDVFLERMKSETNRNARFFASACFVQSSEEIYIFSGSCEGIILQKSDVPLQKGIPLSSYFVPKGYNKTFTELSTEEKNKISHRGKAIGKVREFLLV